MEEKTFAILTKDSVRMIAETAGYNVSDDVASLLGEDVSYRLREAVMKSAAFMKNAKRRRLCPEDFNQALRDSDVQPVYGHNTASDASPFRQTREGELHFVEDNEVSFNNAVFNSYVPKSLGKASIKGQWTAVEGLNRLSSSSHNSNYFQSTGKSIKQEMPDELMSYYNQITQALVGSRAIVTEWALQDLSRNTSVQPLLPYFVNFIVNGVKSVSHDISKLTVIVRTLESLVQNQTLFLETQPYLSLLVQALENCLLEPLVAYISQQSVDHWMLRQTAARLLAQITKQWSNPVNCLRSAVINKLRETLQDLSRPLCSHYGAIMGLMALGSVEVEKVLVPQLKVLLPHIHSFTEDLQLRNHQLCCDAFTVHGAVQLAVEKMMNTHVQKFQELYKQNESTRPTDNGQSMIQFGLDVLMLYQELYDYFGDTLSMQLPIMDAERVFSVQWPQHDQISLGDSDSKRSGEELLSALMQQVQQQEQEKKYKLEQQVKRETQKSAVGYLHHQAADSEQCEVKAVKPQSSRYNLSDDLEGGPGFQEQLAVSSTISDPSKGTLKLKIKRHTQGQGSPSQPRLKLQINKTWTEPETRQCKDSKDREYKHKRKRKQSGRNLWEQDVGDLGDMPDPEDNYSSQLSSQLAQVYSSGGESSGSDSNTYRKGKLMLKLKVPSKDATSD